MEEPFNLMFAQAVLLKFFALIRATSFISSTKRISQSSSVPLKIE